MLVYTVIAYFKNWVYLCQYNGCNGIVKQVELTIDKKRFKLQLWKNVNLNMILWVPV